LDRCDLTVRQERIAIPFYRDQVWSRLVGELSGSKFAPG